MLFNDGNFIDAEKAGVAYYDSLKAAGDTVLAGFKSFTRWRTFWGSRVKYDATTPKGDFKKYPSLLKTYQTTNVCSGTQSNSSNWTSVGPNSMPNQTIGAVYALYGIPNTTIAYAASKGSGIFRTNDYTVTNPVWTCITDASRFPNIGVDAFYVDYNTANPSQTVIHAGTGDGLNGYGLGIMSSFDNGITWEYTYSPTNYGSLQNYYFVGMIRDESDATHQKFYAITQRKVFKTTDGGHTWTEIVLTGISPPSDYKFTNLELHPTNSNLLLIGGNVFYSCNITTGASTNEYPKASALESCGDTPDLTNYTTFGAGEVQIEISQGNIFILHSYFCNKYPFISDILKSTNGGASYTKIANAVQNDWFFLMPSAFAVSKVNSNVMYFEGGQRTPTPGNPLPVQASRVRDRKVIRTLDGGATFTLQWDYNNAFNGVYTHADIREIQIIEASSNGLTDKILIGNDGGIMYSNSTNTSTGKINWKNINGTGLNITEFYGLGVTDKNSNYILAGAQDNGEFSYNQGSWTNNIPSFGDGYEGVFNKPANSLPTLGLGQANIGASIYGSIINCGSGLTSSVLTNLPKEYAITTNFGQTYQPYSFLGVSVPPDAAKPVRPWLCDDGNNLYLAHNNVWQLNQSTYAWTDKSTGLVTCPNRPLAAMAKADNPAQKTMYVGYERVFWSDRGYDDPTTCCFVTVPNTIQKVLYRTSDITAATPVWTDITNTLITGTNRPIAYVKISDIKINESDASGNKFWISFGNVWDDGGNPANRVIYSTDGGATYTDITLATCSGGQSLPMLPVNKMAYDKINNVLYVATDVGVYMEDLNDACINWQCYSNNAPVVIFSDLEINYCSGLLRASTFGRGIWESPLQVTSYKNVTLTANTTWSGTTYNKKNIIVPSGITLSITGNVYMDGNTKITVQAGGKLEINNASIESYCDVMWDGVYNESTGYGSIPYGIYCFNSNIQDMQNGFVSSNTANYAIAQSKFNRNYISLKVINVNIATNSSAVFSNEFTCYTTIGSTTLGTLKKPYLNQTPYTGVLVVGAGHGTGTTKAIAIGHPSDTTSATRNKFHNLHCGIVAIKSMVIARNNNFTSLSFTPSTNLANADGTAIYADGYAAPIPQKPTIIADYNYVNNARFGVYVNNNSTVDYINSPFTANTQEASVYIKNSWKTTFNISNNKIKNTKYGIYTIANNGSTQTMNANTIDNTALEAVFIDELNTTANYNYIHHITNNVVTNAFTGIHVRTSQLGDITGNNVTLKNYGSDPGFRVACVFTENCNGINIQNNILKGSNNVWNWWENALWHETGTNATIQCNDMSQAGRLAVVSGYCMGTQVIGNSLQTCLDAFLLNGATLGKQGDGPVGLGGTGFDSPSDNKFKGSTFLISKTYSYYSDGNLSPLFIRNNNNAYFIVSSGQNIDYPGGIASDPFTLNNFASSASIKCPNTNRTGPGAIVKPSMGKDYSNLIAIVNGKSLAGYYAHANQKLSYDYLYEQALADTSIANHPLLKTFISNLSTTNVGKQYAFAQQTDNLLSNASSLQQLAASISPTDVLEQNQQTLNNINVSNYTDSGYTFSATDMQQLQLIAEQCPYEGGKAVYQARTLLSLVSDKRYIHTCEQVPLQTNSNRIASPTILNTIQLSDEDILLQPNPNNGTMELHYAISDINEAVYWKAYDVNGKNVSTHLLPKDATNITIRENGLIPGIYMYQLETEKGEILYRNKLVISK